MATTSINSHLIANTQHNLSNLSKGVGEFTNGNGKVEVVLDDQVINPILFCSLNFKSLWLWKDKFKKKFKTFIGKPKKDDKLPSISKREINLPKTYSTKYI